MPRFHFNVYDGITDIDRIGTVLVDAGEARLEAVRLAGEIFKSNAKLIALGEDWRMEVTDGTGLILFRFDFSIMATAALPPTH